MNNLICSECGQQTLKNTRERFLTVIAIYFYECECGSIEKVKEGKILENNNE